MATSGRSSFLAQLAQPLRAAALPPPSANLARAGVSAASALNDPFAPPAVAPPVRKTHARHIRIYLLTAAIGLMSLADLHITLTYLRSGGMGEGNPIARYVIAHGSPALLTMWKCASVAFACLIFLRFRQRRSTEIACWSCSLVLVWLLLQWIQYSNEAGSLTSALHALPDSEAALWVQMPE